MKPMNMMLRTNRSVILIAAASLLVLSLAIFTIVTVQAQTSTITLSGNEVVNAVCNGRRLRVDRVSNVEYRLTCLPSTQPPTATAAPPTATTTSPTATSAPPTATSAPPTATPQTQPTATPVVQSGQPCPQWVHDLHVTTAPDGNSYPTWHPPVDPTYGCYFTHEHGDDPRASSVDSSMPAFGYVGAQGGFNEPHAGFKVFNYECGEPGDQGQNRIASRFIMHMGSAAVGRYQQPFHSIQYSARACNGSWEMKVMGMADFGSSAPIGSVCDNPRRGGRDFSTLGCTTQGHPEQAYEIWSGVFQITHPNDPYTGLFQSRAYIALTPALFDPITTVNPNDLSQLVYTADVVYPGQYDPLSTQSPFRGCRAEAYQGPVSINNSGRPTTYVTDAFGEIIPGAQPGTAGTLTQTLSSVRVEGSASNASANGQQFKKVFDHCNPYIAAPN